MTTVFGVSMHEHTVLMKDSAWPNTEAQRASCPVNVEDGFELVVIEVSEVVTGVDDFFEVPLLDAAAARFATKSVKVVYTTVAVAVSVSVLPTSIVRVEVVVVDVKVLIVTGSVVVPIVVVTVNIDAVIV